MRKRRRKSGFVLLGFVFTAALYLLANRYLFENRQELLFENTFQPVTVSEQNTVHFYADGFFTIGPQPAFYDWSGMAADPPFKQDDIGNGSEIQQIYLASENYILTDGGRVFKTSDNPFVLVYENNDTEIWDMKAFDGFLFFAVRNEEQIIEPYVLMEGDSYLLSLDGIGNTHYLDVGVSSAKGLSLLTLSVDTPVPVTRVFHYTSVNQPYGILTLEDMMVYDIFRVQNSLVLVGNDRIMCYNIEGEERWNIEKTRNIKYNALQLDEQILIYGRDKSLVEGNNVLLIAKDGTYTPLSFPKYLAHLQPYKRGFLGLEYNHTVVIMDKQGKVTNKHRLSENIQWIGTTPHRPDTLFILTQENELKTYTTQIRKDDTQ